MDMDFMLLLGEKLDRYYDKVMLHNLNKDYFNKELLLLTKQDTEDDSYDVEVLRMTMKIIEEKDYSGLFYILRNYDGLVKAIGDKILDVDKVATNELYTRS